MVILEKEIQKPWEKNKIFAVSKSILSELFCYIKQTSAILCA